MVRKVCSFCAFVVLFGTLSAQSKLHFGAKLSPLLAWNRVEPERFIATDGSQWTFAALPATLRWSAGLYVDYMFSDNFGLHTGLSYTLQSAGYTHKHTFTNGSANEQTLRYQVYYLQIPVGFRVETNEIFDRASLYFTPGITCDILLDARVNNKADFQKAPGAPVEKYTKNIHSFSSCLFFSTGILYELSGNLKATAGVTYAHGITDIDHPNNGLKSITNESFKLFQSYFSVDIGIRF